MNEMTQFFQLLFSPSGFIPRLNCGTWTPGMLRAYIIADLLTAVSYLTIPIFITLTYQEFGRVTPLKRDARWLAALFGLFIVFCGLTHLVDSMIFFVPLYRLQTFLLSVTAFASAGAAVVTPAIMRRIGASMHTAAERDEEIARLRASQGEILGMMRQVVAITDDKTLAAEVQRITDEWGPVNE
jgi:hypothetical protein